MYIFLDLEMNQWPLKENQLINSEIIEIGAIKMTSTLEIIDYFTEFIKPGFEPILSEHIKALTHISQSQINQSRSFTEVMNDFELWVGETSKLNGIYVWGSYDTYQIGKESFVKNYSGLLPKWIEKYFKDFQRIFEEEFAFQKNTIGLKRALELMQLDFMGQIHRAENDARNLALLFKEFYLNKKQVTEVKGKYHSSNLIEHEKRRRKKVIKLLKKDLQKVINKFAEDEVLEIEDILTSLSEIVKTLDERKWNVSQEIPL